jgi:RimJ/RimL family protein N-acetyltransferase
MTRTLADLLPLLGLRIVAGPLELRGLTDDDLVGLAELAEAGVHPPDQMPFYQPWTQVPAGELPRRLAAYHWRQRAEFSVESWSLELAVRYDGVLVGAQGFRARSYLVTRTGESGSWLGMAHQGRGIGTLMRQALCAFLFDHLGAVELTSGAFVDNPASLAVSHKVGYRPAGVRRLERRPGELALNQDLRLVLDDFVRGPHPIEVEGLAAFRLSIGLDSEVVSGV